MEHSTILLESGREHLVVVSVVVIVWNAICLRRKLAHTSRLEANEE
jgi:hypothetical protein